MTQKEEVQQVIDDNDGDIHAASLAIYAGPKALALYVIHVGLDHLKARRRALRRRELRREVAPRFQKGATNGSIVLTKQAKARLTSLTRELFGKDGWNIGDINIGQFTKEDLLAQASSERSSAKGHIRNAQFYEALAEPLKAGQRVAEYWKPEKASKVRDEIWRDTEKKSPALISA